MQEEESRAQSQNEIPANGCADPQLAALTLIQQRHGSPVSGLLAADSLVPPANETGAGPVNHIL